MTLFRDDFTIDELLGDPVTRAAMRADRVDPSSLEAMLRSLKPVAGRAIAGQPLAPSSQRDEPSHCFAGPRKVFSQLCGAL